MTRGYIIAALRCATLRSRLLANELDVIGIAVRDGVISPEAAIMWARDIGGLDFIAVDDAEFDAMDALEPVP